MKINRNIILFVFAFVLSMGLATPIFAGIYDTTFQCKVEDDDQTPMNFRTIYVYNGDYEHKSAGFDPYPYGDMAKKYHWFVQTVHADANGKFDLDVRSIKARKICFNPGPPYATVCVEKSSDLSHTPSDRHLRVIGFEPGTTQVKYNKIYDLRKGVLKKHGADGTVEEKKFKKVGLLFPKAQ
jgi:hypothetical protein